MSFLTGLLSAVAGPLLGGLFGNKQQSDQNEFNEENYERQRADAIEDQLAMLPRLRQSAESAGFNPLTALGATGGSGFGQTGVGRAPKLASQSLIGNALTGAADFMQQQATEELTHRRASERIKQINEDRALVDHPAQKTVRRTNVAQIKTSGLPTLKTRGNAAVENDEQFSTSMARPSALVPGREVDVQPMTDGPGLTRITNAFTGKRGVLVPGNDGEVQDLGELATTVFFGGPQAIKNQMLDGIEAYGAGAADRRHSRSVMFPGWHSDTPNKARTKKNRPSPQKEPNYKRPAGSAARKVN